MELPQLEAKLRDPDTSNMLVVLLRFIVSAEVQLREEFFAPFVLVRTHSWLDACMYVHDNNRLMDAHAPLSKQHRDRCTCTHNTPLV